MSDLEQAARLALDVLEDLVSTLDDDRAFMTSALSAITALRAALAQQAEPVAIPGAIPMSKVVARSRAMPERADALERARQRLEQAEPVDKALTKTEPPVDKEQAEPAVADRVGYSIGGAKWLHQWSNRDEEETANQWKKGYNAARDLVRIMLDTPQQAEPVAWVGLTDGEAEQTFAKHDCNISTHLAGILARAIEAALKQKNAQQAEPVIEPDDASGNPSY